MLKRWEVFFLVAAFLSFLYSNALWFSVIPTAHPQESGIYVGLWVTSILSMTVFLKVLLLDARK